ncbi:hypothetical protein HFP51_02930 [Parasphingopyxis sp. CP4]|uniref:hypothetical protein n=1 Tax=Parasphingopyxis sp. CP4 TaxID=2724527 RepID=UPI0015A33E83|nr:hypothetical protein [Parasphingopyxis sp. CP4]QLC21231.1 hypothetical protein HFP51_02930 [Parasphingopyxis sp. CP4]
MPRIMIAAAIPIVQYVFCILIAACLLLIFPGDEMVPHQESLTIIGAIRAGFAFSNFFFLATFYVLISPAIVLLTLALGFETRRSVASVSAAFLLIYTALWSQIAIDPFPLSFWIGWMLFGMCTYWIVWLLSTKLLKTYIDD